MHKALVFDCSEMLLFPIALVSFQVLSSWCAQSKQQPIVAFDAIFDGPFCRYLSCFYYVCFHFDMILSLARLAAKHATGWRLAFEVFISS